MSEAPKLTESWNTWSNERTGRSERGGRTEETPENVPEFPSLLEARTGIHSVRILETRRYISEGCVTTEPVTDRKELEKILEELGDLVDPPLQSRPGVIRSLSEKITKSGTAIRAVFHREKHGQVLQDAPAETVGIAAGYANGRYGPYASLSFLAVKLSFQGLGIGTRLINTFVMLSQKNGLHNLALLTARNNTPVQIFYLRHGFLIADQRERDRYDAAARWQEAENRKKDMKKAEDRIRPTEPSDGMTGKADGAAEQSYEDIDQTDEEDRLDIHFAPLCRPRTGNAVRRGHAGSSNREVEVQRKEAENGDTLSEPRILFIREI